LSRKKVSIIIIIYVKHKIKRIGIFFEIGIGCYRNYFSFRSVLIFFFSINLYMINKKKGLLL